MKCLNDYNTDCAKEKGCFLYPCKALKIYKKARVEVIAEISREMRVLYDNDYEQNIRIDTVNQILSLGNCKEKDCHNCPFGDAEECKLIKFRDKIKEVKND